MKDNAELGQLLEAFVNRVSHPRGRVLTFLAASSVTVSQTILLNFAFTLHGSTPSSLASLMNMSLTSVSEMVERLVRLGLAKRAEDPNDRRRKTIEITEKGRTLLMRLKAVRSAEFTAGTASLSDTTRQRLSEVLSQALKELDASKDLRIRGEFHD